MPGVLVCLHPCMPDACLPPPPLPACMHACMQMDGIDALLPGAGPNTGKMDLANVQGHFKLVNHQITRLRWVCMHLRTYCMRVHEIVCGCWPQWLQIQVPIAWAYGWHPVCLLTYKDSSFVCMCMVWLHCCGVCLAKFCNRYALPE